MNRVVEIDRRTPVLVVTRCVDMSASIEPMRLGVVDYLREPIPLLEMRRLIVGQIRSDRVACAPANWG